MPQVPRTIHFTHLVQHGLDCPQRTQEEAPAQNSAAGLPQSTIDPADVFDGSTTWAPTRHRTTHPPPAEPDKDALTSPLDDDAPASIITGRSHSRDENSLNAAAYALRVLRSAVKQSPISSFSDHAPGDDILSDDSRAVAAALAPASTDASESLGPVF